MIYAPQTSTYQKLITYPSIIIIIMSRRQRGYLWPSLAISPYHSSPLAGLQGYILCPHIVAVCKFVLVILLLHIHMWGSTGVHRLWARPCFSSSVPRVWFVWLVYIYIWIRLILLRNIWVHLFILQLWLNTITNWTQKT